MDNLFKQLQNKICINKEQEMDNIAYRKYKDYEIFRLYNENDIDNYLFIFYKNQCIGNYYSEDFNNRVFIRNEELFVILEQGTVVYNGAEIVQFYKDII